MKNWTLKFSKAYLLWFWLKNTNKNISKIAKRVRLWCKRFIRRFGLLLSITKTMNKVRYLVFILVILCLLEDIQCRPKPGGHALVGHGKATEKHMTHGKPAEKTHSNHLAKKNKAHKTPNEKHHSQTNKKVAHKDHMPGHSYSKKRRLWKLWRR